MPNLTCLDHLKPCIMRATRLNETCLYSVGANNAYVTTGLVRINFGPEIEEGEEFLKKNGCGEICVRVRNRDELKSLTGEIEICLKDAALIEILTGSPVTLSNGDIVGSCIEAGPMNDDGVALEIWTEIGSTNGKCDPAVSQFEFVRYFLPRVVSYQAASVELSNELTSHVLTSRVELMGTPHDGPFSDWPSGADISPDALLCWNLDDGTSVPDASCEYVEVPANANDPTP